MCRCVKGELRFPEFSFEHRRCHPEPAGAGEGSAFACFKRSSRCFSPSKVDPSCHSEECSMGLRAIHWKSKPRPAPWRHGSTLGGCRGTACRTLCTWEGRRPRGYGKPYPYNATLGTTVRGPFILPVGRRPLGTQHDMHPFSAAFYSSRSTVWPCRVSVSCQSNFISRVGSLWAVA
jgi:hypothetical protein